MRRVRTAGLLILLAVAGASRLEAADGVEQLNQAFAKAMLAGDLDGVMKLYAADAVLFPPGEKASRGQEEIRYKWNAVLEANKVAEGSFKDAKYLSAPNLSTGWGNVLLRLEPKKPGKRAGHDPGPLLDHRREARRQVGLRLRQHQRARRDPDVEALLEVTPQRACPTRAQASS